MMNNKRAHLDEYLAILNDSHINFSVTAPFIQILKGTDYRVSIANVSYPARIDIVGFFPPVLPAVKYIPEHNNHGRVLAQIDMSAPKDYILDLFRVIVISMKNLSPTKGDWTRKDAPIMVLDNKLQSMMEKIYDNSKEARESERIASISVRPKANDPASKYLAPIAEHHRFITNGNQDSLLPNFNFQHDHDTIPEIVLPILDFDGDIPDDGDNELILDWLDQRNIKTPLGGHDEDERSLVGQLRTMPALNIPPTGPLKLGEAHKTVAARKRQEGDGK